MTHAWMPRRLLRTGRVAIVAASTLSLIALAGCGGGSVSGNSQDSEGKTDILVWTQTTGDTAKALKGIVEDFNGSQSTYVVQTQYAGTSDQFTPKLINAVTNDQGPDLVLGDSTPQKLSQVIQTGKVVPLDDRLDAEGAKITKKNFSAGMLSTGTFDGKIYSLPTEGGDYALYYNKAMFAKAGITSPPTTWAEVAADAAKLTSGKQYGIYLPIGPGEWPVFTWQSALWSAGGEFLSADNKKIAFNSPEGVAALTAWTDILRAGHAYPSSLATPADGQGTAGFSSGKVAMVLTGAYNQKLLDDGVGKENVGVTAFPTINEPAMNIGTNNSYVLQGTTEEQDGAWDFLNYFLTPDVQARWDVASGYLPTNMETADAPAFKEFVAKDPRLQVLVDQLAYAKARPSVLAYDEVSAALATEIEKALLGKKAPTQALADAATKGQAALDKQ